MVKEVLGLVKPSNNEIHSSHVLVSLAQVVVIVDHNSAPLALVAFTSAVVGFDTFEIAILH